MDCSECEEPNCDDCPLKEEPKEGEMKNETMSTMLGYDSR